MDREKAGIAAVALLAGAGAALFVDAFLTPGSGVAGPVGEAFGFAVPRLFGLVGLLALLAVSAVVRARGE